MHQNGERQVVIQQRHRLFREGLGQLVDAEPDMAVVGSVATGTELVDLCEQTGPDVVLLQTDFVAWDPCRLAARLVRQAPAVRLIGLYSSPLADDEAAGMRSGGVHLVRRADGMVPILDALRGSRPPKRSPDTKAASRPSWGERTDTRFLTGREVSILTLVAGGRTSREMSVELDISPKTVENHKQRIFAKLGVQNQAHAVSVAMRQGLVTPDALADLAAAGRR
ncbi:MAG: hypothetical protein V7605_2580 [Acidimicrobiaceae bacterium]|jgi:DNA-binding NarL/FixJ family response regulator